MTQDHFNKSLALLTAFREERVNQFEGMRAVLHVIHNRMTIGKRFGFAGDLLAVVTGHNQFSSITFMGDTQTVVFPGPDDKEFERLVEVVDSVFAGEDVDPTGGSLYYADISSPKFYKNGWFTRTIIANNNRFPVSCKVGTTTYYSQVS